jgi:two-component system chemotaxis response regulator CheB
VKRSTERSDETPADSVAYEIVVVGTSWGGLAALRTLITGLPISYNIPLAIVQHRHRDSDTLLARFLQEHSRLRVCEVEDKQPIEAGHVFIAPANYHMLVEHGNFSLSTEAPVRFSRPSIDAALASAAEAYGYRAVGIVLTGANADGAEGCRRLADTGGMVVIQDPATAEAKTMPVAALEAVPTARVLPLERIALFLGTLPSRHEPTSRTA